MCDLCWTYTDCPLMDASRVAARERFDNRNAAILAASMAPKPAEDLWAGYVESLVEEKPMKRAKPAMTVTAESGVQLIEEPFLQPEDRETLERPLRKGDHVRVVKGRKVPIGTHGVVFWAGDSEYGQRIGLKDQAGVTHWTAAANARLARPELEPAASDEDHFQRRGERLKSDTASPGQGLTREHAAAVFDVADVFEE